MNSGNTYDFNEFFTTNGENDDEGEEGETNMDDDI